MKHHDRATKIVATIGPASRDPDVFRAMLDAGVNVVRMNFSHGEHDDHRHTFEMVRAVAAERRRTVGILQDLQGPKVRVGRFAGGEALLTPGQDFTITMDEVEGSDTRVGTTYTNLVHDVYPGMVLLLDDGNLSLQVTAVQGNDILTRVIVGGVLKNNKGINVPQADLSVPALSLKDIEDLRFGLELGVDWVALSFVRSRDDLLLARHYLTLYAQGAPPKLMAKIEKPQAVERFGEILAEADGIMVARGDLGVELAPERVPTIQKRLIKACREAGKPVITATQMLESMMLLPRPTRAEASDVANAIFDGTDAVMLSGESAAGKYPVEAVAIMDHIAREVEGSDLYRLMLATTQEKELARDAIATAAVNVSEELGADAIVCFTSSGSTARRISRNRPKRMVIALAPSERTCNELSLSWGVIPIQTPDPKDTDDMMDVAHHKLIESRLLDEGDRFVLTAGVPFGVRGTTNMIRVDRLRPRGR